MDKALLRQADKRFLELFRQGLKGAYLGVGATGAVVILCLAASGYLRGWGGCALGVVLVVGSEALLWYLSRSLVTTSVMPFLREPDRDQERSRLFNELLENCLVDRTLATSHWGRQAVALRFVSVILRDVLVGRFLGFYRSNQEFSIMKHLNPKRVCALASIVLFASAVIAPILIAQRCGLTLAAIASAQFFSCLAVPFLLCFMTDQARPSDFWRFAKIPGAGFPCVLFVSVSVLFGIDLKREHDGRLRDEHRHLEEVTEAIGLYPCSTNYFTRCLLHWDTGHIDEAMDDLNRTIEKSNTEGNYARIQEIARELARRPPGTGIKYKVYYVPTRTPSERG
jgi:hypothetical protein